ncbi:MAG: fibronectin type III domain-containing protein [Candidatus Aminicenantes bacterium]|nr:fibronectin type III domain-containing protein [Candidatus Aminicenantes bacterium]
MTTKKPQGFRTLASAVLAVFLLAAPDVQPAGAKDFLLTTQRGCPGRFTEGESVELKMTFNRKMDHDKDHALLLIRAPGQDDFVEIGHYIHLDVDPTIIHKYYPVMNTYGKFTARLAVILANDVKEVDCDFSVFPKLEYYFKTERGCGLDALYFVGEKVKIVGKASHSAEKVEVWLTEPSSNAPFVVYTWKDVRPSQDLIYYRNIDLPGSRKMTARIFLPGTSYDVQCEWRADDVRAPEVGTLSSKEIGPTSAVLEASVNSHGLETKVYFIPVENPEQPEYFDVTAPEIVPPSSEFRRVAIKVEGLKAAKKYKYRAVAQNSKGRAEGTVRNFTTTLAKPEAVTMDVSYVTTDSATFRGMVDPMGSATEYCFSCCAASSADADYFSSTPWTPLPKLEKLIVIVKVLNLRPGQAYSFAVRARNAQGQSNGKCVSFKTGHTKASSKRPPA